MPQDRSLVEMKNLRHIYKVLLKKEISDEKELEIMLNNTYKQKTITLFWRIFYQNSYFEKLFPSVKE
jgi:hypothetical protein